MFQLNRETDADWWEVEALYDLCFAPGREALSSYRLREATPPIASLSQVARDRDGISRRCHSLLAGLRWAESCALAWADCRPPNPAGRGAGRLFDSRKPGPRAGAWLEQGAAGGGRALLPKIRIPPAQRR